MTLRSELPIEFAKDEFCPAFAGPGIAKQSELYGFDVQMFGENHTMGPDIYGEIRDAMRDTEKIKFHAGPVNFVTRDPGVVASAIAPLQVLSGGRMICGAARGDSAVAVAGQRPASTSAFEHGLRLLRTYLAQGTVDFGSRQSSLAWLDGLSYSPVPIEVVCSGPRSIALAAALADRIVLSVGLAPERVSWALEIVDETLLRLNRSRATLRVGVVGPVAIANQRNVARAALRYRSPSWAHMSSFPGNDLEAQPERMRAVTEKLRNGYDYRFHRGDAPLNNANAAIIDEDFAEWFGIAGPTSHVIERYSELVGLGVDSIVVASLDEEELDAWSGEVMPALRALRASA